MPIDPSSPFLAEAVSADHTAADAATACGCPVCRGQVMVIEDSGLPEATVSYLNADERLGVAVNRKQSFTIDRAGLQMTGFDPQTMEPYPGWGGTAGQAFTVT